MRSGLLAMVTLAATASPSATASSGDGRPWVGWLPEYTIVSGTVVSSGRKDGLRVLTVAVRGGAGETVELGTGMGCCWVPPKPGDFIVAAALRLPEAGRPLILQDFVQSVLTERGLVMADNERRAIRSVDCGSGLIPVDSGGPFSPADASTAMTWERGVEALRQCIDRVPRW
jgi:hypothetical protein